MAGLLQEIGWILLLDAVLAGILMVLLVPLCVMRSAAAAVLRRNFVGYFSNPTGYVFLCLLMVVTSFLAFCFHDFFNDNLATLHQLNLYLPLVMWVYIPAITMGIWSEERREGTDELLLTLPATDFDIVIGKFAAATAIYSVSLLFSQLWNLLVLASLTLDPEAGVNLDTSLVFANYLGYWLTGLMMIALGMVGSFLSRNMTVAFVLGMVINFPLVFAQAGDLFVRSSGLARVVSSWSIAHHFDDLARGVISLSSVTYFVSVTAVALYLCMVLIGKRHWSGGRDGSSMLGHYLIRFSALVVMAIAATYLFGNRDLVRLDITEGQVSSLSRETKNLIRELGPARLEAEEAGNKDAKGDQDDKKQDSAAESDKKKKKPPEEPPNYPIFVDAFISADVPEQYVKTKNDLVSNLKEFSSLRGKRQIEVTIYENVEPYSEEEALAEERFGIEPVQVPVETRGRPSRERILMGAAFRCGLEKVVVRFFDYGVPVEYELARSIATVASAKKRVLGVVRTEAEVTGGGFNMMRQQPVPRQAIIDELEKQYDIEDVNASGPIDIDQYDVLMVVQPSSLNPSEFGNVLEAIRAGLPTAIFEDPRPEFLQQVTPTGEPKQAGGGMFGRSQPQEKGDIRELWRLLGITSPTDTGPSGLPQPRLAWQRYLPYPKMQGGITDEWIFVPPVGFSQTDPVTSGLQEVLLPAPGVIEQDEKANSNLEFEPLVTTNKIAGLIKYSDYVESLGSPGTLQEKQGRETGKQVLAARIRGAIQQQQLMSDAGREVAMLQQGAEPPKDSEESDKEDPKKRELNVIYVADIDLMHSVFVNIRARPEEFTGIQFKFENVIFLLNIIDSLSGDDAFVQIRKRKPRYYTLRAVEAKVAEARREQERQRRDSQAELDKALEDAKKEYAKQREELAKYISDLTNGESVNRRELEARQYQLAVQQQISDRKLAVEQTRLQRDFEKKMDGIQRDVELEIRGIQLYYKIAAVAIPWIPPAIVGLLVLVLRRFRETEGVSRSRLR